MACMIGQRSRRPRGLPWLALAVVCLAGCTPFRSGMPGEKLPPAASVSAPATHDAQIGRNIADAAAALLGATYRYGGAGPDTFDCSGLVSYVHRQFGYATPRTAAQQFAAATPVPRGELRPGDLVFFRLSGATVSHVGVYIGNDEFVHAPQTGTKVRVAKLEDDYYRHRYVGGGRLYGR
jgi:cell wall-associated NlpC family hydrolase